MDALDYFMLALKCMSDFTSCFRSKGSFGADEKNEQFKILIRSKIDDYLSRAETLQKHLSAPAGRIQGAMQAKRYAVLLPDPQSSQI